MIKAEKDREKGLKLLGFDKFFQDRLKESEAAGCSPARVTEVHRDSFTVRNSRREIAAEVTGNLSFSAESGADLPCVGDWVMARYYDNEILAIIHSVFPRKTFLRRKTPGRRIDYQMIAANIDYGMIVQAADADFNIRRLERYLVMVREGGIEPIILLTKIDLISPVDLEEKKSLISNSGLDCETIPVSNITEEGHEQVSGILEAGKTYCLIGSSGVGKTTLLNRLIGQDLFSTKAVRAGDGKGRHTTTRRQLTSLENGAMIIDTPGMRELGSIGASEGIEETFSDIEALKEQCLFSDCSHTREKGCAVLAAIANGTLDEERCQSYLKLLNETRFHQMSFLEKKKREKDFGRMVKSVIKHSRKK